MAVTVRLLGPPGVDGAGYRMRSRKSWALLGYLLLGDRPPARRTLARMLYAEADDPLRALRWGLAEIRRGLGATVDGDPVTLRLPAGTVVDVAVLTHGSWSAAVELPGLGAELLDGIEIRDAPAYGSWLLSERRRVAAAAESILHEAALARLAAGDLDAALGLAVRAAAMSPLDENHQALLIRLYRLAGADAEAEKQFAAASALFRDELGVAPGPAVREALREVRRERDVTADESAIEATVEAGAAAVAAGAVEAGVRSLRASVRLADRGPSDALRLSSRLTLAEALIHSQRGMDEEGLAALHEADRIARATGDRVASARARAEIGYVDFLRARYDRAERWLTGALEAAAGEPAITAKATTYLGAVASDRAAYPRALDLLHRGAELYRRGGFRQGEAYARSMAGRASLLSGDLVAAAEQLDAAIALAEADHWLAFLPWPQALRGEVLLAAGDVDAAEKLLQQAFARACQVGDPCWEGLAARGLAMVAEARGDSGRAFGVLADALSRSKRLADPYVWLEAHILDTRCELGRRHDHPDVRVWTEELRRLAARIGYRTAGALSR